MLVVAFQLDDKQQSWTESCGYIQRLFIFEAPNFVKYDEHRRKIEIKPQNKVDKGMHKMLIMLVINSQKSLHLLEILVKLPVTYIDPNLKPFFSPGLEDETKKHGEKWQEHLSAMRDPAGKFVYVSKSRIEPELAAEFVKMMLSSDTITNATQTFIIDEHDYREKTGNVSFFIELSAFNQNHSVYASHSLNTKI